VRSVQAKKNLGQHFLKDAEKAHHIVDMLSGECMQILEIGPGMGILTDFLFSQKDLDVKIVDIDSESIRYLLDRFPDRATHIIEGDFLQIDLKTFFHGPFAIIGNFPYNISSQILFRILENRDLIPEAVGMFQKEVAERIAGSPGGREYGILSVLMQTWYDVNIAMQLDQEDFTPPPKVKSAVLTFRRKPEFVLGCDEKLYKRVIKAAFNQRRKTLRNALSVMVGKELSSNLPFAGLRAEALSWEQFTELTRAIQKQLPIA
jgi:16S rRNA (adenine1518-N6/adenine1519-N6)-dimethyltransferase